MHSVHQIGCSSTATNYITHHAIFIVVAEIEINDFGESVQVTDLRSGAVIGFKKYR